jgi:nuclear protein localization family protein 4
VQRKKKKKKKKKKKELCRGRRRRRRRRTAEKRSERASERGAEIGSAEQRSGERERAMLLRIRSRDGLERIAIDPSASLAQLQDAIASSLAVPVPSQIISLNRSLLLAKDRSAASSFRDLEDKSAPLSSLGLSNGSVLFLFYEGERSVPGPAVTPSGLFGKKMTIDDLIARQMRIERQENPHCSSVSFDRDAASAFQQYVNETLAFAIKRGGIMYGSVDERNDVSVEFIYEPPQQGAEDSLVLLRDPQEEKQVEAIAMGLGMRKVGFIFIQTLGQNKRDYTLSGAEIRQAAELHAESGFDAWVTAVVKLEVSADDGSADVHFEAFQLSDQCIKLWKDGWFAADVADLDPKLSRMSKDVVVLGKDTREVDNDFFLVLVKILDHQVLFAAHGTKCRSLYMLHQGFISALMVKVGFCNRLQQIGQLIRVF